MTALPEQDQITVLLRRLSAGDRAAEEELYPLVYRKLRNIAADALRAERPGHTLQPTALLHEAFLKLAGSKTIDWASRAHFYLLAARIMRRVLISHARAHRAQKRQGGLARVDLDGSVEIPTDPGQVETILSLDVALERLRLASDRAYQVVELHFFAGLSFDEIAEALNIAKRTAHRDWEMARAWLHRELASTTPKNDGPDGTQPDSRKLG